MAAGCKLHPSRVRSDILPAVTTHLHVRDVPDPVYETLRRRARRHGQSLRQYTIAVLTTHCALPTLDEWLDEVKELRRHETRVSAAEAVRLARDEDDEEIAAVHRRR